MRKKRCLASAISCMLLCLLFVVPVAADPPGVDELVDAVNRGDAAQVRALLAGKADVRGKTFSGATPLWRAAVTGSPEITRLLLDAGADPNAGSDLGSPLFAAIANTKPESAHASVIDLLLAQGADVKIAGQSGLTPLLAAVWKQDAGLVQRLITLGADVNRRDASGETPLGHAALKNDLALSRLLIEAGADVNQPSFYGSTPIFPAAENGSLELVKFLLDKGARLEVTNDLGLSPLTSCVALLGMKDMTLPDSSGLAPQPLAEAERIISFLLDQGLDPNQRGKEGINGPLEGMTPLMYAAMANNEPAIRLLAAKGARLTDTLLAPKVVQAKGFEKMLEGATPLMLAVLMEQDRAVRTLLDLGADPTPRTARTGFTAAMLAVMKDREDLVGLLTQKGGQLTAEDRDKARGVAKEIQRSLQEEDL